MAFSLKAIIVTALLGFLAVLCPMTVRAQSLTGWNLVWSDEFNGTSLDTTKWGLELNEGDPGSAVFTGRTQNLFVSNGRLVLQAQKETYNGKPYTTSQISSRNNGYWRYCRVDVRAKLPVTRGMWPAIWMMPQVRPYGGWPTCGEIDQMENLGDKARTRQVITTLHYGSTNQSSQGVYTLPTNQKSLSDTFHVYTMIWDSTSFKFYLDSATNYWNCTTWSPDNLTFPKPFDQPCFLILDLAVGGSWAGSPDSTTIFPQQYQIDWVRIYQRPQYVQTLRPSNNRSESDFSMTFSGHILRYEIKSATGVRVALFDGMGRKVVQLVNSYQPAGRYNVDCASSHVRPGLYLCVFENGAKKELTKIVLK